MPILLTNGKFLLINGKFLRFLFFYINISSNLVMSKTSNNNNTKNENKFK